MTQNYKLQNKVMFKGPCSPKRLCALVLLFWPASFVECRVLISNYAKFPQCIQGDNGPLSYTTDALVFSAWPAYKKEGGGRVKFVREVRGEREARSGTSCVGA